MLSFNKSNIVRDLLGDAGSDAGGGAPPPAAVDPAAVAATPPPASTGGIDWGKFVETLPEDIRKEPSIASFKDPVALVKSYISAQKMVGKDKIVIPDAKHATEEDWLGLFRKLGAPEKLEDYNFKLPEGAVDSEMDPEFLTSVKEAAVKAGVLPHQFEKIFGAYYGYAKKIADSSAQEASSRREADVDALKKEWGQAFDAQVKRANIALKEFVKSPEDRQRVIEDGLGSHPVLMKILANASKLLKEDTFLGHGDGVGAGITPEDALQKARTIQGDKTHPYRNPSHPNHLAAKKEVADLYRVAFPE
jgi:hypothetical protein